MRCRPPIWARPHDAPHSRPKGSTPSTARATSCTASPRSRAKARSSTLLGRNGAGKTTTLRSLMGLTPPRAGPRQGVRHARPCDWPPFRIAALGVGYVPEGRRIFPNLTVDENLKVPLERPGPWTPRASTSCFPRLAERKLQSRPAAVRRRAGDALDRPRAADQSQAADSRRAVTGPGAADRARSLPHRGADARRRASRCCWSSRTCA